MKGMQAISRGNGFGGTTKYGLVNKNGDLEGEILGGNMSGTTAKDLTKEFGLSRKIRPDIKNPVWHNTLRLPEGDKLSKEQWVKIADDYMKRMGFTDGHQRVYILHDDAKGQHIHIIASRISLDNKIYHGKNENLKSTKHIQKLERDYGLTLTKGPDNIHGKNVMPDIKRPTQGEVGKFERTGETPERVALAKIIDTAIADKPTATVFAERLAMSGVEVRANFNKGSLNGFSFSLNGTPFKGSQLGKAYTGQALLERGMTYVEDRDYAQLRALSPTARNAEQREAAASSNRADEPSGNPGTARNLEADAGRIHRGDGQGDYAAADGAGSHDSENTGRDLAFGAEDVAIKGADREVGRSDQLGDRGVGQGEGRPGSDSSAVQDTATASPTVSHAGVSGAQSADTGHGISAGTDVGQVSTARTGDEATDRLISLYDKAANKLAGEAMARQKKQQAEDEAASKKRTLSDRKTISALFSLLDKVTDPQWRNNEVKNFTQAVGATKFEVAIHDPSKKRQTIQKTLTAEQLKDPAVIRKITNYSAQNLDIFVRPAADSGGAILLQGLSAADVQKLEAIGLAPAATVDAGGKIEAWIKVEEKLSADEQKALKNRLAEIVGVPQSASGFGRLTGYSRDSKGVTLSSHSGQAAPAVVDLLQDVRAEIAEAKTTAKMTLKLEQSVVSRAKLDVHSFPDIAGIRTLKKGWFQEARDEIEGDLTRGNLKVENAVIEDKLLQAMARQKVPPKQAYSAVVAGSRVDNSETHAALSVSLAYTRVALEREGKKLDGIDLAKAAQERFPELMKQAESGMEAQQKAIIEQMKQAGLEEQERLEKREVELAEERRQAVEAQRKLEEEDKLKKG